MNMSKYVRVTKTVSDKGILVKPEEVDKYVNSETDYYVSTYYYNEDQYKQFQQTGTVTGIEDVKTDKLWFDFDGKDTQEQAKNDAIELIKRLKGYNVRPDDLEIYFSGNKGFHVILNLNKEITPKQAEFLALHKFGQGLQTLDVSIYNPSRILRVPNTKHKESGLYKTQLSYKQLTGLSVDYIRKTAEKVGKIYNKPKVQLDDHLFELEEVKKEFKQNSTSQFDVLSKPRQWKASKWALMQGFFGKGERSLATMILASTCKAMGYDKTTTYYMCKSALQKSWERNGQGSFNKEELWNNVIETVFADTWRGGSYSEKEDAYLQKKCEELGIRELVSTSTVDIKGALRLFKDYAKNIDALTLRTGITELDKKQRITVGMSWGIIAAPGTGKTSIALQILHSMSKNGELCVFFSFDMFAPHVIQKIIQKHWKGEESIDYVFKKYTDGDENYIKQIEDLITTEYPNIEFCFEGGMTVDDMRQTIRDAEQKRGKKCRFIVVDYNELVVTDVGDPTQSSNVVAQKIRALAVTEQICALQLFQPNKASGDPSSEIKSYLNAKGGGGIGQSVSLMLGVSRPGYDPRNPDSDKYLSMNVVKNRMGPIFYVDLHWNGYKGEIRDLTPVERQELAELRQKKLDDEKADQESWD